MSVTHIKEAANGLYRWSYGTSEIYHSLHFINNVEIKTPTVCRSQIDKAT